MDVLKILIILCLVCSCARIEYLGTQGVGQLRLLLNAEDNEKLLASKDLTEKQKKKIRLIEKYKKHFYQYWNKEQTDIYSKTTILEDKAVSYLVIASQKNEIKAKQECFPFAGCFPYLGFFKKNDALEHSKLLQKENYVTYVRPVYAYSTLGKLDDPILSSFFYYDEVQLANLIFHELFHTIFFVKDDVDLNENLANFIADKMVLEYFKDHPMGQHIVEKEVWRDQTMSFIVKKANALNDRYKKSSGNFEEIYKNFMTKDFTPYLSKMCASALDKNPEIKCWPEFIKWNNASFAAFMTYEKESNRIEDLYKKNNSDLKMMYAFIERKLKSHQKSDSSISFGSYIFLK